MELKSDIIKYKKLSHSTLDKILSDIILKESFKKLNRTITLFTGVYGMICFDFAMLGLKLNLKLSHPIPVKRGSYRYQINIFEKHGLYKLYVKDRKYFLFKGTNLLGKSKSTEYLLKKIKL
jgi:hypothetical protein